MKEAYVIFNSLGTVLYITSSKDKAEQYFKDACEEEPVLEDGFGFGLDSLGNQVFIGCGPMED